MLNILPIIIYLNTAFTGVGTELCVVTVDKETQPLQDGSCYDMAKDVKDYVERETGRPTMLIINGEKLNKV